MSLHKTVLKTEATEALQLKEGMTVVDATAGSGGHSEEIARLIGESGTLIALDQDPSSIERVHARVPKAKTIHANFRDIKSVLEREGVGTVDAILADLGWSTDQFEDGERGFSFKYDEPLLMTYGKSDAYEVTARDIVNSWGEVDLANLIYEYGEERASRRIAKAIVEARKKERITTSGQLASIIESSLGRRGKLHPATKTFQALRIAVNDELGALAQFLEQAVECLTPGGRLAVITFHSIEDRIVKQYFRKLKDEGKAVVVTKKPIIPTREELLENPRARSAKLRIIETSS